MKFKPLLAYRKNPDLEKLHYPLLGSAKLDGIRAVITMGGWPRSRKLKPFPNLDLMRKLEDRRLIGLDGELAVGEPVYGCFNPTQSVVMSHEGDIRDVTFHVFDTLDGPERPYRQRLAHLVAMRAQLPSFVRLVYQQRLESPTEVLSFEEEAVQEGYEGIILRSPRAPYKFGRSTLSEEYLLKLKRFEDGEGTILHCEEQMENTNPAEKNELGNTKRSSHKAGMVPKGTLGRIIVRDLKTKLELSVGNGLGWTLEARQQMWNQRDKLKGKLLKYRFQAAGMKDKPRFIRAKAPVAVGLRSRIDL